MTIRKTCYKSIAGFVLKAVSVQSVRFSCILDNKAQLSKGSHPQSSAFELYESLAVLVHGHEFDR